ncbi:MAG: hypothetical protein QOH61_1536 [Chloroflexota bacterium]|jgi:hypothetical protein|nr:hypothetical protein [Chloroflexota bacterium]
MRKLGTAVIVTAALLAPLLGRSARAAETFERPIAVQISVDADASRTYELQVGERAWLVVIEGAAFIVSQEPLVVVLWRLSDCAVMATFTAPPESGHRIYVDHGKVRVFHDGTAEPSGFAHARAPSCALPPTSTADTPAEPTAVWLGVLFGVVLLFAMARTPRRSRLPPTSAAGRWRR